MKMLLAYTASLTAILGMGLLRAAGVDLIAVDAALITVTVAGMMLAPFSLTIH